MSKTFATINIVDFEYEIEVGGLPRVLCMIVYVLNENLQHVRTIRMWRGEFGSTPPFDVGHDTLFVAYSAWAEMTCFIVLGWPFPVHVFDLHTAYLAASNILRPYNPDEVRTRTAQGPLRRLPRLWDRRLGEHRQTLDRQSHRRRPLARVRQRGCSRLLRRGREELDEAVARTATALLRPMWPHAMARRRRVACPAMVELQREGGRTASKRAACRSTCRCGTWCRKTSCGDWRTVAAVRP